MCVKQWSLIVTILGKTLVLFILLIWNTWNFYETIPIVTKSNFNILFAEKAELQKPNNWNNEVGLLCFLKILIMFALLFGDMWMQIDWKTKKERFFF